MKDFFISYTAKDEAWAKWIAWQLEQAGHSTVVQAWDMPAGSNFAVEMQKAAVEDAVYLEANRLNKAGFPAPLLGWQVHLRAVTDAAQQREAERAADLCNELGYHLWMIGDLRGGRPYHERALAIQEKVLGAEHPDTALSLNNLGFLLQSQGDVTAARPYYERALTILEAQLGPDHPDTKTVRRNLASLD